MAGRHLHPDTPELREQYRDWSFTPEWDAKAKEAIARYPEGRQRSAVMALLDYAQRQIGEETGTPAWLVEACHHQVGDLAETLALLLDDPAPGDEAARDFAATGYRKGVPMGGLLPPASSGKAPQLAIRAVKDPEAGNLDRIQIVKGWMSADGKLHEKVFDVAWSGSRRIGADGKLPSVGNTVDIASARYSNTIGAAELAVLWTDPEFNPAEAAFYYVRVLEIPTPRQHLFDALAMGIDPATLKQPPTIQERAWSSPVWYRP